MWLYNTFQTGWKHQLVLNWEDVFYGFMVSNGTGKLKTVIIWVSGDDCLLVCLTLLKWCLWGRFIVHFVFWGMKFAWVLLLINSRFSSMSSIGAEWKGTLWFQQQGRMSFHFCWDISTVSLYLPLLEWLLNPSVPRQTHPEKKTPCPTAYHPCMVYLPTLSWFFCGKCR